ncbi:hypothetical protein Taro_000366, partial [Colocasia esculenta]|nr:hypothetical protein [Colocasia esculenta]
SKCVDTQADCVDTTGFNCSDCFLGQSSSVDTQVDCVDTTGCFSQNMLLGQSSSVDTQKLEEQWRMMVEKGELESEESTVPETPEVAMELNEERFLRIERKIGAEALKKFFAGRRGFFEISQRRRARIDRAYHSRRVESDARER